MQLNNKQSLTIVRFLLFTMGLILSGHSLAARTVYATDADLDTEIRNRKAGDETEAAARDDAIEAAIETEVTDRNDAIDTAVAGALPVLPAPSTGHFSLSYNSATNTLFWESLAPYQIGSVGPAGGIVFRVSNDGLSGLEAAPAGWYDGDGDADPRVKWGCFGTLIGASGTAIGTGAQNTADILEGCSKSGIAAEIADAYELNGYTDWFLPSKTELDELHLQKDVVGGFANGSYWSSSEISINAAVGRDFGGGNQIFHDKSNNLRVRAVRAFKSSCFTNQVCLPGFD